MFVGDLRRSKKPLFYMTWNSTWAGLGWDPASKRKLFGKDHPIVGNNHNDLKKSYKQSWVTHPFILDSSEGSEHKHCYKITFLVSKMCPYFTLRRQLYFLHIEKKNL